MYFITWSFWWWNLSRISFKIWKLVTLHKNKYNIHNQHGNRFSGNWCAYCHIYHGEISNFKCILLHFCTTLIYQIKCVTMYIVCHTMLVKLQSNPTLLKTTKNRHWVMHWPPQNIIPQYLIKSLIYIWKWEWPRTTQIYYIFCKIGNMKFHISYRSELFITTGHNIRNVNIAMVT